MYVSDNGNRKLGKFGAITGRLGEVYTAPGANVVGTDSRDTYLVREMHRISQAIYTAKQQNNVAEVERLLSQFRPLADEYRERGAIGVSPFDTFLLATEEWVRRAGSAVGSAVSEVGWGAAKSLIPFALIGAGLLYFKGKLL